MSLRVLRLLTLFCAAAFAAACSSSPESPLSPTSITETTAAAAADGSTLKVTAPVLLSPGGGETVGTSRPSFSFRNSGGTYVTGVTGMTYRLQLLNQDGSVAGEREIPQTGGDTTIVSADADLELERNFSWRVRAELANAFSSWSAPETFRTPNRPATPTAPTQGGVGPARSISLQEAYAIIRRVHDDLRWNLGSASSRDQRVEFLFSAVAAIHYGHPRFNPAGPDSNWCVKDAGQGRPPSDDVLVQCRSRDAWDLIGGAGANGYFFHLDYLGVLPGIQNVYPPPASYLRSLGR